MCFSATASFTAAGVLSVMGMLTIKAARTRELRLFASIPLFFALQQLLEGMVWVTLMGSQTESFVHLVALYGFLFFAGVFWPIWIPGLLYRLEEQDSRKRILKGFLSIGFLISSFYLLVLVLIGSDVQMVGHHLAYPFPTERYQHIATAYGETIYYTLLALYVTVIVGACFTSSFPRVWIFGLFVGIALILAHIFYAFALGSVWCYFSALISGVIYFVVKKIPAR
ncbi:MAG: DUF6629 family protein [Gammaproteobacteria bacterium]